MQQASEASISMTWLPEYRPDEIISLQDAIALYDFTYSRYPNVFRLILPSARQILLRATDEADLNLWMSTVNYGATFRSMGIRIKRGSDSPDYPPHLPLIFPTNGSGDTPERLASKVSAMSAISAATIDELDTVNTSSQLQSPPANKVTSVADIKAAEEAKPLPVKSQDLRSSRLTWTTPRSDLIRVGLKVYWRRSDSCLTNPLP